MFQGLAVVVVMVVEWWDRVWYGGGEVVEYVCGGLEERVAAAAPEPNDDVTMCLPVSPDFHTSRPR